MAMPRLTVIGIGSPFADDNAGWCVVETLIASRSAAAYDGHVVITACASPASELLGLLMQTDIAIVVDALCYSGAPGTIYRMSDIILPFSATKFLSSHGLDLQTMQELAGTLGQSPRIMILYGIEAGPDNGTASSMCQSVRDATAWVADDIRRDIVNYCLHDCNS